MPPLELVLCGYCDTVHRRQAFAGRKTARCVTCGSPLYRGNTDLGAMLAVTVTAATAFAIANLMPLMTLTATGQQTRATLWHAIVASYNSQLPVVATALLISLIIAPLLEIGLLLWVLVPLCAHVRPLGFMTAMWIMQTLRPWRMVEVFFLGVIVAAVKLSGLATAEPGWGAFGVAVMTFALAALASFDVGELWRRADEVTA
ncbi:MAG TPA: paraquat-inducible protein A [Kofleriaceae bacterium]